MTFEDRIAESSMAIARDRLASLRGRVQRAIGHWEAELTQQCDTARLPPEFALRYVLATLESSAQKHHAETIELVNRHILAGLLSERLSEQVLTEAWRTLLKAKAE